MAAINLETTTTFNTHECINCGVLFAMTAELDRRRHADHELFYCPNGHGAHYTAKTAEEKLRDELAEVRRNYAEEISERQRVQRRVDRLEKRAQAGMCSKCNRSFQNVSRHMKTKHPV